MQGFTRWLLVVESESSVILSKKREIRHEMTLRFGFLSYYKFQAAVNQFMDLFLYKLPELLKCPVCHKDLLGPVTLSCGYTVCQACIPAPRQGQYYEQSNLQQQPIFLCPVLQCQYTTHLFGRAQESCIDSVVQSLCLMFHYSSSSSSSVMTGTMTTNNPMTTMSTINNNNTISQQQINSLMECYQCNGTFHQPTTTHCGHVYCRLCLLQLKLNGEACPKCQRPLPRYNYIQNQAAQNRILVTVLEMMESSSPSLSFYRPRQRQQQSMGNMYGIPMFVTGLVILPYQHARIPVYMANHIQMLRRSTFTSLQHNALCLPVVHRGRPNLSQFGTLVEIISVEHQQNPNGSTAVILEVRGCERFSTNCVNYEDRNMQDLSILLSDITFVPESLSATNTVPVNTSTTNTGTSTDTIIPQQSIQQRIQELASQVHMFIEEIAAAPPLENVSAIHTSTFGLLGPLWFETMERVHGKLPSRDEPAALTWWTAVILPVSGAERYALLRTIHLHDRLELVLSWIKQLDGQWKRWRQAAVNTVAAAIQPQSHQ
ncbi:ATP-dependent protease La domain-containing protein [Circinella umbellata]|nr:ATP-dependent protease La domain-containing protein [Circinella umbellata]